MKKFTNRTRSAVSKLGTSLFTWLFLAGLLLAGSAQAQINYVRSTFTAPYNAISVAGGATALTFASTDEGTTSIALPFNFTYNGVTYIAGVNFMAVSTNGWAMFSATSVTTPTGLANNNLYTTTAPNATLAPWWDDMNVGAVGTNPAGAVLYQAQGTPGSQTLTIQWTNISSYWSAAAGQPRIINFQVILYEGTNVIEFKYGTATGSVLNTNESASIGIKSQTGGNNNYIDAVTGSKNVGNGMMNTNKWPNTSYRFTPGAPTVLAGGTYTVGIGQMYNNLSDAIADINHRGISGAVTLSLTDVTYDATLTNGYNIFPILLGPVAGNSSANTITIQPVSGTSTIISEGAPAGNYANEASSTAGTTSNEPVIGIIGTDYVTLDNLAFNTTGTGLVDRGIIVANSSATNGATNNMITDITVVLNRTNTSSIGISQNTLTTATSAAGANSMNKYYNLQISNVYAGIYLLGTAAFPDLQSEIGTIAGGTTTIGGATANDIGNGTSASWGIRAAAQSGVKIFNTEVRNVTASGALVDGIFFDLVQGTSEAYNNKVHDLRNASTTSTTGVTGIRSNLYTVSSGHTANVYNNFVYNINSSYTGTASATRQIKGIFVQSNGGGAGNTQNISFNSVSIDGTSSPNISSTAFEIGTTTGPVISVMNNIFANFTGAQSGVAKHYTWVTTSATSIGNTGSASNYNDLYIANAANGFVGLAGTTDHAVLSNWQSVASNDALSRSIDPMFISNTGNLHINNATPNQLESSGTTIAGITTDIDGDTRPGPVPSVNGGGTAPDIGADEFDGIPVANCSGTPVAGTITGATSVCTGTGTTLSLTGASNNPGITYQWASSTTPGGPYTNMGTATAQATGNLTATTYYVVTVTCSFSGLSSTTPEYTLTVNPNPTVTVTPTTALLCNPGATATTLTASGATTYTWGPAAGLSATTGASVNALPASTTTYTVTGTASGCTGTATAVVTVASSPVVTATATPASVCPGANSQLQATAFTPSPVNAYLFSTSTGATLDPMTGATTVLTTNNDDTPTATPAGIGFTFNFNGVNYTQYSVSPDGWILLGGATATGQFTNTVTSGINIPKIYPFWDDHATGSTGNVRTLVTGTASNRIFKVQWFVTIPRNLTGAANSTFQAWLYEADGRIEFRYGAMGAPTSGSISAGLTGGTTNYHSITISSNTSSTTVANDLNTTAPASGRMYTFTPPAPASYLWSPTTFIAGQETLANPVATGVTATTTYTVTTTSAIGCSSTASTTVTVGSALSSTASTTPAGPVCEGTNVTFNSTATGGGSPYTFAWAGPNGFSSTAQNPSLTVTPAASGTYTVTITDACSATSTSSVTLTVNPNPTVSVTPSSALYCNPGPGATLTANGATTYSWAPATGLSATSGASVTATPGSTTTYTVTGTDGTTGCSATATTAITSAPAVTGATATATPASICAGNTTNLNASAAPYAVTVFSDNFNGASSWTTGNTSTPPASAPLVAWTLRPNGWNESFTTFNSNDNSQFYLSNSDIGGSGNNTNTTLQSPAINTVGLATCTLSFYHFYQDWDANDAANVEVSTDGVTWTNVQAYTTNQGTSTGFVQATINLNAYINQPTLYIRFHYVAIWGYYWAIDNVAVTGTNSTYTYSWTSSPAGFTSTAQNPTGVAPSATTTYSVAITNPFGCSATANTTVTVNPAAVGGTISPNMPTICSGTSTTLTLTGYTGTIQWYQSTDNVTYTAISGATSATYTTPNLTADTWYGAIVTNGTCVDSSSNTAMVMVTPAAVAGTLSAGNSTLCTGDSTLLTLSGNTGTIQWQMSSDNITFTNIAGATASTYNTGGLTATTYYRAMVTNTTCVDSTSSVTITVNPAAAGGTVSPNMTTICEGTSTTVTLAGYTGTIQWYESTDNITYTAISGATSATYTTPNLTADTWYGAIVTNGTCVDSSSNTAMVMVTPAAVAGTLTAGNSTLCTGDSTLLTLSGNTGTIQWQVSNDNITFTNIAGATASTYNTGALTATTYYRAMVTNTICMDSTSSVTITVSPAAVGGTVSPGMATICEGGSTTVTLTGYTGAIQWYESTDNITYTSIAGATSDNYTTGNLTMDMWYGAIVSNGACVDSSANTAMIMVTPAPVVTVSNDTSICAGNTVTLIATGGDTYAWDNGAGSNDTVMVTPAATTVYNVIVTDNTTTCSSTASVTVTVSSGTAVAGFTYSNPGATVTFTNTSANAVSYSWDFGDGSPADNTSDPSHTYVFDGTYIVTLIASNGCSSDTITDTVVVFTTGIVENSGINVNVMPNPSEGMFTVVIKSAGSATLRIEVLDIQGQLVYVAEETNINTVHEKQVDLSGLAKGVYYLRLNTGSQVITKKVITQ